MVVTRPGPVDDANFPPTMQVEELPEQVHARLRAEPEVAHEAAQIDLTGIGKVRRFPRGLRR